jgi:hypothetical protein
MTLPSEKLNRRGQDPSFILSLGGHAEEAAVVTAMRVLGSASCSRNAHRPQPPIMVRFLDALLHQSTGRNQDAKKPLSIRFSPQEMANWHHEQRLRSRIRHWRLPARSSRSSLNLSEMSHPNVLPQLVERLEDQASGITGYQPVRFLA